MSCSYMQVVFQQSPSSFLMPKSSKCNLEKSEKAESYTAKKRVSDRGYTNNL